MAATQKTTLPPWWNQPLPAGYEIKYDHGTGRYFYINHTTRETTWVDPRQTQWEQRHGNQQNRAQLFTAPQNTQQPRTSPRQSPRASPARQTPKSEQIAMKDINQPQWRKDVENKYNLGSSALWTHNSSEEDISSTHTLDNPVVIGQGHAHGHAAPHPHQHETSFILVDEVKLDRLRKLFPSASEEECRKVLQMNANVEEDAAVDLQQLGHRRQAVHAHTQATVLTQKLKKQFPSVPEGVLRDILWGVKNNEEHARSELRTLGYKQMESSNDSPHRGTSHHSHGHSHGHSSHHGSHHKAHHAQPAAPQQPQITDAEKSRLKLKLQAEFIQEPHSVIEMALEASEYSESQARSLLKMMVQSDAKGSTPQKKASPTRALPQQGAKAQRSESPMPEPASSNTTTITVTSAKTVTDARPAQSMAAPRKKSPKRHQAPSPGHAARASPSRQPKMSQSTYKSKNRTMPKGPNKDLALGSSKSLIQGPDTSLAQGPNKTLLLCDYVKLNGPNPSLHFGPNRAVYNGPLGTSGVGRQVNRYHP